jgi:uncharacterized repeat protein (TIGR01451 family)
MKKGIVILSILVATVALAMLMLSVASAAPSAPAQRVTLTKTTSNPTPRIGEIFTFTLGFNTTSEATQTIQVRVTDPNPASAYLRILTPTITGGGTYSATIDGVVWEGALQPGGASPQVVTFQVQVTDIPAAALATGYPVTNTVTMVDLVTPGSLPETTAQVQVRIMPLRLFLPLVLRNYTP